MELNERMLIAFSLVADAAGASQDELSEEEKQNYLRVVKQHDVEEHIETLLNLLEPTLEIYSIEQPPIERPFNIFGHIAKYRYPGSFRTLRTRHQHACMDLVWNLLYSLPHSLTDEERKCVNRYRQNPQEYSCIDLLIYLLHTSTGAFYRFNESDDIHFERIYTIAVALAGAGLHFFDLTVLEKTNLELYMLSE
jgi:hypothetical protein